MTLRGRWQAGLAKQLGRPTGVRGRIIGAMLNRRNQANVTASANALRLGTGDVAADVGFGGGVGLDALLRAAGNAGQIHGVEVSETMLVSAARRFRREIAAGRLRLHSASIMRLPFEDSSLDGAITVNTIYFLDDLGAACAELARVMKPSGRVVVGLSDPIAMAQMPFTAYGFRTRPLAEVMAALDGAGLRVELDQRLGDDEGAFHLLVCTVRALA